LFVRSSEGNCLTEEDNAVRAMGVTRRTIVLTTVSRRLNGARIGDGGANRVVGIITQMLGIGLEYLTGDLLAYFGRHIV
jgi:hypothetical protein